MRAVLLSGASRLALLVPAAIAGLVASHVILHHWGLGAFDSYALIVSLMALLPVNDLGVGAAVTSALAENGPQADPSRRTLLTAVRVLCVSSLAVVVASATISAVGLWPDLLGSHAAANAFDGAAVAIYAVSFVPGVGQSVLLGIDRNHVTVWINSLLLPLTLIFVAVAVVVGAGGNWVVLAPAVAILVVCLALGAIAVRAAELPAAALLRDVPRTRRAPGRSIRSLSGPMLVVALAVPLALQSDRIVLSHVSTATAVAQYSVTVQLFAPVLAIITAAAAPLWPMWTRARTAGTRAPALGRVLLAFCGGTAVVCAVIVVLADPVGRLVGGDAIRLGILLPVAAGAAVVMQAAAFPAAMALMEPAGARLVATWSAIALPVNVGLSVVLARTLGPSGPLFATAAVGFLLQTLPAVRYARGRSHLAGYAGRHRPPLSGELETRAVVAANLPT